MAKIPKAPINRRRTDRATLAGQPHHRHGTPDPPQTRTACSCVLPLPLATAQNADKASEAARPIPRQGHSIVHASDACGNRQRPTGRALPQAERRATPQEMGKGADVAPAAPEVWERGPRATECVPPPGVASRPRGAAPKCVVHRLTHKTVLCARLANTPSQRSTWVTTQGGNASSASSCGRGVRFWLRTQ